MVTSAIKGEYGRERGQYGYSIENNVFGALERVWKWTQGDKLEIITVIKSGDGDSGRE